MLEHTTQMYNLILLFKMSSLELKLIAAGDAFSWSKSKAIPESVIEVSRIHYDEIE